MSDQQQPNAGPPQDHHDATGWIILGAVLIVAGFFLGARNFGWVPWQLGEAWDTMVRARTGIGIILLGAALIWWAQSGRRISTPPKGTKLLRSRSDKWLAGVLGGLAKYFGMDATILRLAFIALVVLFDIGALVVVYIVMAIVVPQEPAGAQTVPAAAWPNTPPPPPPPPAPVAPPAPPAVAAAPLAPSPEVVPIAAPAPEAPAPPPPAPAPVEAVPAAPPAPEVPMPPPVELAAPAPPVPEAPAPPPPPPVPAPGEGEEPPPVPGS